MLIGQYHVDVFDKMRNFKMENKKDGRNDYDVLGAMKTVKTKSTEEDLADYLGRAVSAFRQGNFI